MNARSRLGALRRRLLEPERASVARDTERLVADLAAIRTMINEEHAAAIAALHGFNAVPRSEEAITQPDTGDSLVADRTRVLAIVAELEPVLEIRPGDTGALASVAEVATASQGAAIAIGAIETLPAADVVDLIRHCVRVVRPGGRVVIESANPTVLATFTGDLYRDPRVRRPYHPSLVRFLLAEAGCGNVEISEYGGADEPARLEAGSADRDRLNAVLFGPVRYIAVGYR